MRVITGSARGKKLKTLDGLDVRPTTDRVKEGIFNVIQFDLPGTRFLDLFAGSGQIGIEALSRGAEYAVFIDESPKAQQVVKENLQSAGLFRQSRVMSMEAGRYLESSREKFDIAYLDPPYQKEILPEILPKTAAVMAPEGMILCEHLKEDVLPECVSGYTLAKRYTYGKICVSVYRPDAGHRHSPD